MRKQISEILVKYNMPTRQVAINEIVELITTPMGVSQWREYGKKYDYWSYFEKQAINKRCNEECEKRILKETIKCEIYGLLSLLEDGQGGGNWRRIITQRIDGLQNELKNL